MTLGGVHTPECSGRVRCIQHGRTTNYLRTGAALLLCSLAATAAGQPASHTSRFEITEAFLKDWAHRPVQDLAVTLDCAGPVHPAPEDCELHIGATLDDPSISDFQGIVLEPPNVCAETGTPWRARVNQFKQQSCMSHGFLRLWPEHLTSGHGCSNPNHVLEVHPLLQLRCGNQDVLDFSDKLRVVDDLGYKSPTVVRQMLGLRLWVCRGCTPGATDAEITPLAFDYCFGTQCTRQQASNFARIKVRIITSTIRPKPDKTLPGFATAIARVAPVDQQGHANTSRMTLLKLYALEGSDFHAKLLSLRTAPTQTLDVIGIFTVDPFSVLKTIEAADFPTSEWVPVPFSTALIVFGEK